LVLPLKSTLLLLIQIYISFLFHVWVFHKYKTSPRFPYLLIYFSLDSKKRIMKISREIPGSNSFLETQICIISYRISDASGCFSWILNRQLSSIPYLWLQISGESIMIAQSRNKTHPSSRGKAIFMSCKKSPSLLNRSTHISLCIYSVYYFFSFPSKIRSIVAPARIQSYIRVSQ
jgi:hypothetical protein